MKQAAAVDVHGVADIIIKQVREFARLSSTTRMEADFQVGYIETTNSAGHTEREPSGRATIAIRINGGAGSP